MLSESVSKNSREKYIRVCISICLILAVIFILLGARFRTAHVPFWQYTTGDIVVLLVSILLISTFIERTDEVIIIVWREHDKQKLTSGVETLRKRSEQKAGKGKRKITLEEEEAVRELDKYKADTRTLATHIAFLLGVMASAVGVRLLQHIVDPAVFDNLSKLQISLFTGVDIIITGALLGGGSKGIHEILEAFLNTVEKYRDHLKEK